MSDYSAPVARRQKLPALDYQVSPPSQVAAAKDRRSRWGPPLGLMLYGFSAYMAVNNDTFRHAEMHLAGPASGLLIGEYHVRLVQTSAFFNLNTSHGFGLDLSAECTSALLLIPLFVMMGSFMTFSALNLRRQVLATVAGAVLIVAVNTLRIALIAWATWNYGTTGYNYSHVFVGSAFSLVGFVGAMLVALWILVRADRAKLRMPHPVQALRGGRHRAD
jgi:exosortase/archaeosortase family protein